MARPPRYFLNDVPLHIIQRGNNRQPCFYNKIDYAVYLNRLQLLSSQYDVAIHSYVLMSNHVHLLLSPSTPVAASKLMQALGSYYVRYINTAYSRTGTLWEGRFRASLVDTENYFLTVSRYIELNPVRAEMVAHPSQYPWSSYQHNALGKSIKLLKPHKVWLALGNSETERQENYKALFNTILSKEQLDEIRACTNKGKNLGIIKPMNTMGSEHYGNKAIML